MRDINASGKKMNNYQINALHMREKFIQDFFKTGVLYAEGVCVNDYGTIFETGKMFRVKPDWKQIRQILNSPFKCGWWHE